MSRSEGVATAMAVGVCAFGVQRAEQLRAVNTLTPAQALTPARPCLPCSSPTHPCPAAACGGGYSVRPAPPRPACLPAQVSPQGGSLPLALMSLLSPFTVVLSLRPPTLPWSALPAASLPCCAPQPCLPPSSFPCSSAVPVCPAALTHSLPTTGRVSSTWRTRPVCAGRRCVRRGMSS